MESVFKLVMRVQYITSLGLFFILFVQDMLLTFHNL